MIPVLIQMSFHKPNFFLFERICPYEPEKKCVLQHMLSTSHRMKRSDGPWFNSLGNCFCSSPNILPENSCFFSGIIQTLNFSRKFQDFQGYTVAFLVILPFFNEGLNLKPCKTQVTRQKLK